MAHGSVGLMKRAFDLRVVGLSPGAMACGPGLEPEVVVHPPRPTVSPENTASTTSGGCPAIGHAEPLIVDGSRHAAPISGSR